VAAALQRWKLTRAARNHDVRLPNGETCALDEVMGLLQEAISTLDLPVVDAQAANARPELAHVTGANAAVLKRHMNAIVSPSAGAPGAGRTSGPLDALGLAGPNSGLSSMMEMGPVELPPPPRAPPPAPPVSNGSSGPRGGASAALISVDRV
jgi:hypothetical protein